MQESRVESGPQIRRGGDRPPCWSVTAPVAAGFAADEAAQTPLPPETPQTLKWMGDRLTSQIEPHNRQVGKRLYERVRTMEPAEFEELIGLPMENDLGVTRHSHDLFEMAE